MARVSRHRRYRAVTDRRTTGATTLAQVHRHGRGDPSGRRRRRVASPHRRIGGRLSTPRKPQAREVLMVTAAIYLRRPLLVTGNPGTGKSSLAYLIARELGLG